MGHHQECRRLGRQGNRRQGWHSSQGDTHPARHIDEGACLLGDCSPRSGVCVLLCGSNTRFGTDRSGILCGGNHSLPLYHCGSQCHSHSRHQSSIGYDPNDPYYRFGRVCGNRIARLIGHRGIDGDRWCGMYSLVDGRRYGHRYEDRLLDR